ncbi:MAG TPA: AAC(3)-I family aminoglycoside N-acetyltransferase [Pseudomonadota bacterium]|nr:AAC(3)-I family aminoglycoside N-acetyltransferase [Pseudomonadota bacterium]
MLVGMPYAIHRLLPDQLADFRALNALYAAAFEDDENYLLHPPSDAYVHEHLSQRHIVHLVAKQGEAVIGALSAYILAKHEQDRSETYIYDLAVAATHRRQGIATALIEALKPIAREQGAWVIFVQADPPDAPAVALYTGLGSREDVLHFDIPV